MSDIATCERLWLTRSPFSAISQSSLPLLRIVTVIVIVLFATFTAPITASDEQQQPYSSFNSAVLSASIKIVREIRLHHHDHQRNISSETSSSSSSSEVSAVKLLYEGHIYSCLSKISTHLEHCVQQVCSM